MATYPERDEDYMMTEPGSFAPDRNSNIVRIIMHQTWAPQTIRDQATINYREWTKATRAAHATNPHSQFGVSAHITVEWDGRIFQHVDTKDGARGTRDYACDSIHIEFAARDEPLTNDQISYGAGLTAWIASEHPNARLVTVGTNNKDSGNTKQQGITVSSRSLGKLINRS
jgi:N-acetyl-anhydromuramyl-L-alanine amidase AmpD